MSMTRYRFGLTTIGFYVIAVITAMLVEGMNPFAPTPLTPFSHTELILISVAYLLPAIAYYITERVHNRFSIDFIMLPICVILFAIGTLGIWRIPNGPQMVDGFAFTYEVDVWTRIYWTIALFATLFTLYLAIGIFAKRIINPRSVRIVSYVVVLISFISIIVSLATEMDKYVAIFQPIDDKGTIVYQSIHSFFLNENSYGQMLLLGILAMIMINAYKHHWWHSIIIILFYDAMIFSTSFTALAMSSFVILVYFIYKFFSTIRKHHIRNTVLLSISLFVVPALVGLTLFMYYKEVPVIREFGIFFKEAIASKDFMTATGRTKIWTDVLNMMETPLDYMFGMGYKSFNVYFGAYNEAVYGASRFIAESGYIQVFGSFGFVGIIIYVVAIVFFIYKCISCFTHKKWRIAVPSLICFITICLYSIFETYVIGEGNTIGLTGLFIFMIPTLIECNSFDKRNDVRDVLSNHKNFIDVKPWNAKRISIMVSYFLSLLVTGSLVSFIFTVGTNLIPISMTALLLSFVIFLINPYLYSMWSKAPTRNGRISRYIIMPLMIIALPSVIFVSFYWLFEIEVVIALTVISFILATAGEIVWTLLAESSAQEMYDGMIRGTLKPHIIPLIIFGLLFVMTPLLINMYYPLSDFSKILILIISILWELIMVFYVPNFPGSYKDLKETLEEINKRYLLIQRTNYPKPKIKG